MTQQDLDKLHCVAEQHRVLSQRSGSMEKVHNGMRNRGAAENVAAELGVRPLASPGYAHRLGLSAPPVGLVPTPETAMTWGTGAPSAEATQLIMTAMLSNPYLSKLREHQRLAICQAMQAQDVQRGDVLMTRGELGDRLYVTELGSFEIRQASGRTTAAGPGEVLGEMAILYKCTRTATVTGPSFDQEEEQEEAEGEGRRRGRKKSKKKKKKEEQQQQQEGKKGGGVNKRKK